MAAPVKLAHVVFKTGRLKEMVQWYCNVLEGRVVYANDMLAFVTYDDEHHRVAFVATGAAVRPTEGHSGLHHMAFTYGSLEDLLDTFQRLQAEDLEPFWCVNHGPATSMYFEDPDGNQIELQIDNFERDEDLEAFFASGKFDANPIGITFDPEDLVERFESGETFEQLVAI